jgi:hypothetical protein
VQHFRDYHGLSFDEYKELAQEIVATGSSGSGGRIRVCPRFDGALIYWDSVANDIVIVWDGKIQTMYKASEAYFERECGRRE